VAWSADGESTGRRPPRRALGPREFTVFLAMSMALAALGIDLMLPAFRLIRADLGLPPGSTAVAGIVTTYFVGLAAGTVVYGPLADHFGRRAMLYTGFVVYALGAAMSAVAPSLGWLLAARFVWGFGAAGPRVVTLAVVRDTFEGERMSRAMSMIFAVFVLVPVIAPALGALAVTVVSWRWLFASCLLAAAGVALWARRLPETLAEEHRLELSFRRVGRATRQVVGNRRTVGYTLALTVLYGAFISYLATAENLFATTFGVTTRFPLYFGLLAATMGVAMVVNARVVERVGVRRLAHGLLVVYVVIAAGFVALAVATDGRPPLGAFLGFAGALMCAQALVMPNCNTIAMQPMAAIAGTASAVIGATQIAVGALLGALLDRTFDGSILPLTLGFLGYGVLALTFIAWAERWVLFQPLVPRVDPEELARDAEPPVA